MIKIKANYHSHTARCGHAKGEDREYVEAALVSGVKTLGFSDHVMIPGFSQKGTRGDYECFDDYVSSVLSLRKEYQGKMDIHLGFEAEYFEVPDILDYYRHLLKDTEIEYLILGQHFGMNPDHGLVSYTPSEEGIRRYTGDLIKGIRSGLFSYVCHPDLLIQWATEYTPAMERSFHEICKACVECDIPVEINLHKVPAKEWQNESLFFYASRQFFEVVSQYPELKCIIGIDAHAPSEYAKVPVDYVEYLIEKYHLHVTDRIRMIRK